MDDSAKYLIHADITADGVVERSDVVGAVFGQTEGLLGDELDIRDLQQSSRLGRIDVEVESENGRSFGQLTIASNLDRVETAILAAALETIERVGPCRASVAVRRIEDVRAAKRREVIDRATELLATAFDDAALSSAELVEEVRESVRVEDITSYEGLPAGPRVAAGDAVVVVEGRADVLTLLQYGVKNAVAVEGTDVPDAVADLTGERTTTAFLDGDRGGDLILRELAQVGDVDYVARAPEGRSVEDLSREEVRTALREKVPFESASPVDEDGEADDAAAATDGSATPAPATGDSAAADDRARDEPAAPEDAETPTTLAEHAAAVVDSGTARLLDGEGAVLAEGDVEDAVELAEGADGGHALLVDAPVTQRLVDVAAQRGIAHVVGSERGAFTKRPTSVRVRTAAELASS
ncbi:MAG: DNA primase DnaG [Halobacteriaceae archaeon]